MNFPNDQICVKFFLRTEQAVYLLIFIASKVCILLKFIIEIENSGLVRN